MTWKNETTKKGKRLPPPLPMYETVKLKHVPTMVRRRYDRDLNIVDKKGLSSEDGKSEGDGIEDDEYSNDAIDVDDNVDNSEEEDDDTQANFEHDESHPYREDLGDIKSQDDNDRNVDSSVEDDIQDLGDMDDHGSYSKIDREEEDEGSEVVDIVSSVHDNEEESMSKDQNDEDDGPKDATLVDGNGTNCYEIGSVQDEVQDNQIIRNFDNQQGLPEKDDKREGDETEDVIHDAVDPDSDNRVLNEAVQADDDAETSFHTKYDKQTHKSENFNADDTCGSTASKYECIISSAEENKFKDEIEHTISANDSAEASVVEDCIQDQGHKNSDNIDQGSSCSKEFEEDNIVNNVKLASDVDTSVKDGVQHHEQVLQMEDRLSDDGGARDVNGGSNKEGENVKIQETIENKREIDIKQGLSMNYNNNNNHNDNNNKGEEVEDDIVSFNRDVDVETNIQDTRLGASNDKQVLTPETFMETLERDGYELYCPNCNHSITRTILFRRREDHQQCKFKTSCFSFLGSLFCCSRW